MAILTRYLIRSHLGPFIFSFSLLTGLLFLNTIAQRLDQLIGKGLPWTALAQFAVLALPHTVALTLPMSVLVAVLYAFSDLTAENEITAMTAGGVNPVRILLPLAGIGVILFGSMFLFMDRVLPEANHALKNLMVDIGRKSPTFQLREQVVNAVVTENQDARHVYYLQAVRIDPATSVMEDIVIYDVSDPQARRTTYAERGTMAFNADQTDLFLTLYDGAVLEVPRTRIGTFQRSEFKEQFFPMRDIGNVWTEGAGGEYRTDREMSTQMLADTATKFDRERADVRQETKDEALFAMKRALGWRLSGDSLIPPPDAPVGAEATEASRLEGEERIPRDDVIQSVMLTTRRNAQLASDRRLSAIKYRVEIHKKWAISFACLIFVLVGAPLALRFPRGGVGMVITASVAIFALFWVFLIGGEALADDGILSPALAMWAPNLILLPFALVMVSRMSRQMATARAGGWDDLFFTVTSSITRPFRKLSGTGGRA